MATFVDIKFHNKVFIDKDGNQYKSFADFKNKQGVVGQTSLNPIGEDETTQAETETN